MTVTAPPLPQKKPRFKVRKLGPHEIPPETMQLLTEERRKDQSFTAQFGHVRPPISAEYQGHKFVAVGNQLIYQPLEKAQFFTDILLNFVPNTFGREWFEAEIAKPSDDRHPVMQSRIKAMTYMNKQPRTAEGTYAARMTGPMLGYFTFAYDLFVVKDNGRLDGRLLERLKNCDQFQGARHELFAEATCLRAGFDIEHEDETDGSMRHAEFTATHRFTGQKVSVEAKSRHRPGVLGQPGTKQNEGEYNLRVGTLLNDAVSKNTMYPLIVFLDLNLPWTTADRLLSFHPPEPPHPLIHSTLNRMRKKHSGMDPINLLVVTNHPEHYSADEEAAPTPQVLSIQTQLPAKAVVRPDALLSIHQAANMYGRIPQFFDGHPPANLPNPATGLT